VSRRPRSKAIEADQIPVIDIAPLRDNSDPVVVGERLAWAAREVGFIYVNNHGVDAALIRQARSAAFEFFHLPEGDKLAASTNEFHHGYLRPGSTRMYDDARIDLGSGPTQPDSKGWQTLPPGAKMEITAGARVITPTGDRAELAGESDEHLMIAPKLRVRS